MRKYIVIFSAGFVLLIGSISGTSVAVAFPVITSSLNTSLILASWILSITPIVSIIVMPLVGKFNEIYGRKFIFITSIAIFTFGSLLCALASNIYLLILFRLIQAIGGGTFLPSTIGIAVEELPEKRQQLVGLFGSIFPLGMIIGPNLGGWLVDAFGWQSIFWLNIPLSLIMLVICLITIRKDKKIKNKLEFKGVGLLAGALLSMMIGLSQISNLSNFAWIWAVIPFAISALFINYFYKYELKSNNPIIDLQVLTDKPFLAANIFNFIFGACVFGIITFLPLYAVSIYNMSTLESGVILTPRSIGMMILSAITSMFLVRWGYRKPMLIGTIIAMLSFIFLALEFKTFEVFGLNINNLTILLCIMFIFGVGMGISGPASNNASIELMPTKVATITGVRGMFRNIGGAISIPVVSLILNGSANYNIGFTIAFMIFAALILFSIPLIYLMPESPNIPTK